MKKVYLLTVWVCLSALVHAQKDIYEFEQPTNRTIENRLDAQRRNHQDLSGQWLPREQYNRKAHGISELKSNPAVPANKTDSLALVALYNSTNGPKWRTQTAWLIDSVYKWYGIKLDNAGRVIEIRLRHNNLEGNIPPEIGDLSGLVNLELNGNKLSGSIPAEIGKLSNLLFLKLEFNKLSGSIPAEIGKLSNLQKFVADYNQLSGSIPAEIGNLSNLLWLILFYNQLSGSIPAEIGNLSSLQELYLHHNQLSGSLPAEIGNLSNLKFLDLESNQLSGSIPPEIGKLSNLHYLSFFDNQLSGSIPPEIGKLSNLSTLRLSDNQLSGSIPPEIGGLSNLYDIYLDNNQLSGSIPPEIGELSNLGAIGLSGNQLSGSIPAEIGKFSPLQYLNLRDNQLSGAVPVELGNLYSLGEIDLSSNLLTDLPDLSALRVWGLHVSDNKFTFEDIEPNINLPIDYSPQAKVGTVVHLIPSAGEKVDLVITVGGTANTYQWYKDGAAITGATDSIYTIAAYDASQDKGTYYCEIKNTIATALTLTSYNYYIGVSPTTYNITATADPAAGGTVTGAGTYNDGETATVTATANTGYQFANWTENGKIVSVDAAYSFTVSEDRTLVANFTVATTIPEVTDNSSFVVYPNPTTGRVNIRFSNISIEKQSDIKLYLIDNSGRRTALEVSGLGSDEIQTDIGNNKRGFYYLQLIVKGKPVKTFKVILSK